MFLKYYAGNLKLAYNNGVIKQPPRKSPACFKVSALDLSFIKNWSLPC